MQQLVNPNWHVILIHYPLALLAIGILIELLSFLWRRSTVRAAGRWMIALGTLALIPALFTGLYAYRNVVSDRVDLGSTWQQVVASNAHSAKPWSQQQWDFMEDHIELAIWAAGIFIVGLLVWLGASDLWRRRLYFPILILFLVGLAILSMSAWHAGEAVYRYGTAVGVQPVPYMEGEALPTGWAAKLEEYLPPLQLHLLLAGAAVALAVGALGLSIRRTMLEAQLLRLQEAPPVAQNPTDTLAQAIKTDTLEGPPAQDSMTVAAQRPFPARFWLLAGIVALAAAAAGLWYADFWPPKAIKDALAEERTKSEYRHLLHLIFGVAIVLLCLILAVLVRFAPRSKVMLGIFTALLAVAVAGQIRLGTLLLYDSESGPTLRFNPAPITPALPAKHP